MQKMCIQVGGGVKNPESFAYVNTWTAPYKT